MLPGGKGCAAEPFLRPPSHAVQLCKLVHPLCVLSCPLSRLPAHSISDQLFFIWVFKLNALQFSHKSSLVWEQVDRTSLDCSHIAFTPRIIIILNYKIQKVGQCVSEVEASKNVFYIICKMI